MACGLPGQVKGKPPANSDEIFMITALEGFPPFIFTLVAPQGKIVKNRGILSRYLP
jgi:hypothetical protein